MSSRKDKLPLKTALKWAERVAELLRPHCDRVEIAGSVRREKNDVGDIEIVCIPKRDTDLLGAAAGVSKGFVDTVERWEAVKGSPTGRYTQRVLPNTGGFTVDLFMADRENFGWIFALRTGSDVFNQVVYLRGLRAVNCFAENGYVYDYSDTLNPRLVPLPEEEDLFKLIGAEFVHARMRDMTAW